MELFFFDIETVGNYKNYQEFETLDYKGSSLFRKKYEKMKWDETQTIDDAYINNSGIISTYGKIVCISFGYIKNDGSYENISNTQAFNAHDELYKYAKKYF